ncbi:hypothetical protein BGZ95_011092 [Linnemannia exigua]|uniref:Yeast cell wall synthesis Kre9/Knh1-like N-terminal domain-containing protein n=1 Tax=Linnemannia exigua TaxID=604196 RepID=A0AAD4HA92_9FUNG|nr:hypothetical protein BGZ95_011092 [Linnemannia exigua]
MKSIALIALSALALASQASAQLISYSAPIASTVWKAGSPATISWTNSCSPVEGNTTFPVYLNQQVGQYQEPVPGIPELGYLDCKKAGKLTVQVPANLTQGNNYSILVTNGNQSYSALFTIQSNITGPVTTTTLTTPLPTTTVAPVTTTPVAPTVTTPNKPTGTGTNQAAVLKAGSQAALVIVAAVASMML